MSKLKIFQEGIFAASSLVDYKIEITKDFDDEKINLDVSNRRITPNDRNPIEDKILALHMAKRMIEKKIWDLICNEPDDDDIDDENRSLIDIEIARDSMALLAALEKYSKRY